MSLRTSIRFALCRGYNPFKKRTFKTSCLYSNKVNAAEKDDDKTTHFGFKTIKESEKTKEGISLFYNQFYSIILRSKNFIISVLQNNVFIYTIENNLIYDLQFIQYLKM